LAGLLLGVLAIISGGKIATTLLVMGLPLLDVIWVVVRRIFLEKKSPVIADRKHLHFRLLDLGFSHRQAVLFLYLLAVLFGSLGLFQNTLGKLSLFFVLAMIMVLLAVWLVFKYRSNG
jgi:UDP-GlcNAc:undecaprenyl-phosphate GlcNAc-1-phosphate transferase